MDSENERKKPLGFLFDQKEPLDLGAVCRDDDFTLFVTEGKFREALINCMRSKEDLNPSVLHYTPPIRRSTSSTN